MYYDVKAKKKTTHGWSYTYEGSHRTLKAAREHARRITSSGANAIIENVETGGFWEYEAKTRKSSAATKKKSRK